MIIIVINNEYRISLFSLSLPHPLFTSVISFPNVGTRLSPPPQFSIICHENKRKNFNWRLLVISDLPWSKAYLMEGMAATMRALLEILPSAKGTLKSTLFSETEKKRQVSFLFLLSSSSSSFTFSCLACVISSFGDSVCKKKERISRVLSYFRFRFLSRSVGTDRVVPCRAVSCRVVSCCVVSCPVMLCRVVLVYMSFHEREAD